MKPYYEDSTIKIFNKDCRDMPELPDESVDLIVTDPPYQLSTIERFGKPDSGERWSVKSGVYHRVSKGFMGQKWDVLPPVEVWQECLRVLKPGAFAFIMTTTRQDSLCQILTDLTHAGFQMSFSSIYWGYASGFPKAQNIGKAVDKRLGVKREVIGQKIRGDVEKAKQSGSTFAVADANKNNKDIFGYGVEDLTLPATPQAKALDGSYGGFQPKPAVEVIIVAMKPLSEKTFVDQALKNRKGITWLDDGRVPIERGDEPHGGYGDEVIGFGPFDNKGGVKWKESPTADKGRFPANLLVSDDVLNDGRVRKSGDLLPGHKRGTGINFGGGGIIRNTYGGDSGSFSRYFDLDAWWAERIKQLPKSAQRTFPFLVTPKASKSEKDKGLEGNDVHHPKEHYATHRLDDLRMDKPQKRLPAKNYHPTVKPVKLMSYLITLGSREGDTVVDNFGGSGTTPVAAQLLGRKCIMYEIDERYCEMAVNRCKQMVLGL